jgi:hypothetical protein
VRKLDASKLPDSSNLTDHNDLKAVIDVDLPRIKRYIEDCKKVLNRYAALPQAKPEKIKKARDTWEQALNWTEGLMGQYRDRKLNLDVKPQAREVTFTAWKQMGGVSIYEFFTLFEEWSAGHLSENERAYQLYHKYLDKSIVDTYDELRTIKTDSPR